jgi:hypothetical protein
MIRAKYGIRFVASIRERKSVRPLSSDYLLDQSYQERKEK